MSERGEIFIIFFILNITKFMFEKRLHRNSQKRFYGEDKIYFITTVTHQRFPFFKEDLFCKLFVENLRICKKLKKFKLYAFIIIPDHVHLLLKSGNDFNISKVMQSFKQNVSCDINRIINHNEIIYDIKEREENENIFEGETPASRLQIYSRFLQWDKINKIYNKKGIDIKKYIEQFIQKYNNPQFEMPKFKWQKSFYDHVIRNEKDFLKHLNYIVFNCVKHKVCQNEEKYKWSNINQKFANFIDDWQ